VRLRAPARKEAIATDGYLCVMKGGVRAGIIMFIIEEREKKENEKKRKRNEQHPPPRN
jgi:hypothetical protein